MKTALIGFVTFLVGGLAGVWASNSGRTFYFVDHDTVVPAFFTMDLQNGLTGTMKLRVAFDKGKVISVDTTSTEMTSTTDFVKRYPSLVRLSRERIMGTIKEWHTSIVSPFSTEVTVALQLDPSLPMNARTYQIEYGKQGVVSKLVMTGPILDELKRRLSEKSPN
jgi:hypothetical protein